MQTTELLQAKLPRDTPEVLVWEAAGFPVFASDISLFLVWVFPHIY